ncbi:MAG: hypothetical protein O7I42_16560 [Alphaproteobacteria bacterium]|nr:hypothetical protein [Alphaproteobacteria bacterium]
MGIQEEQERRRDLLQRALEACSDPEQALAMAVRMEHFIIDGQISREKAREAVQPEAQLPSEEPRKTCNRSRWTDADDAHLRQLWQDDLSVEAIAGELQRTLASIYARVRILDLSSNKNGAKNGARKEKLPDPGKHSSAADSKGTNGFEAVGIDGVVHFLRTRDFTVVPTEDDRYELDGRKILTAQELFDRANNVRAQLKRPKWAALENGPIVESPHKTKA